MTAVANSPAIVKETRLPLSRGDRNENPPGLGLWALLREDLRTHDNDLLEQGFWAVAVHRFGNWRMGVRRRLLRAPLTLLYVLLYKIVEWTCGVTLPYTTRLGRRVRIWHHSGMILHARSIGDDVHIRHNTTFGVARTGENGAIPVIGDRVDIGCGVSILGAVNVGADSVIGAHSLVLSSTPPGAVAVGVPARVVKTRARSSRPGDEASYLETEEQNETARKVVTKSELRNADDSTPVLPGFSARPPQPAC